MFFKSSQSLCRRSRFQSRSTFAQRLHVMAPKSDSNTLIIADSPEIPINSLSLYKIGPCIITMSGGFASPPTTNFEMNTSRQTALRRVSSNGRLIWLCSMFRSCTPSAIRIFLPQSSQSVFLSVTNYIGLRRRQEPLHDMDPAFPSSDLHSILDYALRLESVLFEHTNTRRIPCECAADYLLRFHPGNGPIMDDSVYSVCHDSLIVVAWCEPVYHTSLSASEAT